MAGEILYIKAEQKIEVKEKTVKLSDVATIYGKDKNMINRLNSMKFFEFKDDKHKDYVFSILKVIEFIQGVYPDVTINNLGETDFIVSLEDKKLENMAWSTIKAVFVSMIIFVGAAFAIMTFNNDVDLTKIFGQLYELFLGEESDGFGILEISYSVGLTLGIIVFFNHFSKKKITNDPTPLEIEMRIYEKDINEATIEGADRRGNNIDVS